MLGRIATAAATVYGYKTIGGLITANSGLIIVLIAFIFVCLVFRRLLNRQFPSAGRQTTRAWIFKAIIVFMIASFVFICAFTVFYERKKMEISEMKTYNGSAPSNGELFEFQGSNNRYTVHPRRSGESSALPI